MAFQKMPRELLCLKTETYKAVRGARSEAARADIAAPMTSHVSLRSPRVKREKRRLAFLSSSLVFPFSLFIRRHLTECLSLGLTSFSLLSL